jgi:hypothetical protein
LAIEMEGLTRDQERTPREAAARMAAVSERRRASEVRAGLTR